MKSRLLPADVLVPGAILVLGVFELASVRPDAWLWGMAIEAVASVLVVWRRFAPLVVCTLAELILLVMPWAGPQLDEVAAPILWLALICYSLGRWIPDLRGLVGIGLLLLMLLGDYLLVDGRAHNFSDVVFAGTLAVPPYLFGRISRKLALQSELLARQSEQLRDQAVRDERDRIARELHDVVAHSVSAMVVQTAAAQDLVRTDPDRAAGLLASVAETGRRALAETGRLLHLVRDDADELGLAPAPGLADVPALVDSFREGGLAVEARLDLPPVPVAGGIDVSAYRVVQEALTNALKYADGSALLSVDAVGERVHIACSNPLGAHGPDGSGLGLQGMAERVGLLGGTLRHGRDGDGRFEVDVVIPLVAPSTTEGAP